MRPVATVTRADAAALLIVLGVDTAGDWPIDRLSKTLNDRLDEYLEGVGPLDEAADTFVTLTRVADARDAGVAVEIVDTGPYVPPHPNTPKVPRGPARPGRYSSSYGERRASWADKPISRNPRLKSVVNVVVRELAAASRDRPVTKRFVHGVLVLEFPDRDPAGMLQNVYNLIPGRLKEHYGIVLSHAVVSKNRERGFWIERREKTQPVDTVDGE